MAAIGFIYAWQKLYPVLIFRSVFVLCSGELNFVSREMEGMSKDMDLDKFNSR